MKKILTATLVTALVASAAALAAPGDPTATNASAACTALKAKMGTAAFVQAYATFGACVSTMAKVEAANTSSAEATCAAEQNDAGFAAAHDGKTFVQLYGTGKKGRNAFGNCVSTKAKASSQAEAQGRVNPAQTCRAIRTQLGASTFAITYGANANDRNAFGKCVSKTAKAQSSAEVSAASTCRAEQSDSGFAGGHDGKTFDAYYGTNVNDSNAFGMCVSSKAKAAAAARTQATVSAAKTCRSERDAGVSAFTAKYGTFGRCVSQHAK